MVLAENHLGVDEDVGREEQCRDAAVDELAGAAVREEHEHEAEEDEAPEGAKKVGRPRGEVVFGLAGKQGEEDKDAAREDDGVEDDGRVVQGDDDGDGVRLEQGEARQEEKVGRVRFALPVGEAEEDEGAEELRFGETRMRLALCCS